MAAGHDGRISATAVDRAGDGPDRPWTTAAGRRPPGHDTSRPNRLVGRRPLPSGRAVVGGLLVALAMLVSFAAASHHGRGPQLTVVVARHGIRPGTALARRDVTTEHVQLPPALAARTFSTPDQVVGQVTLAPLGGDELIERAAVVEPDAAPELHELSFPVDRERALDGDLEPGQFVDVLATYGTGLSAQTVVVARGVRLVDVVDDQHQGLESTGKLVVTVALADADQALEAAHASQVGAVTLLRAEPNRGAESGDEATSYSLPSTEAGQPASKAAVSGG